MQDYLGRYLDLVHDKNVPYGDIHKIIEDFIPPKLYRYRRFGEYWVDEIINGNIYMAFIKDMNDPYDGNFIIDTEKYQKLASKEMKMLWEVFGKEKSQRAMNKIMPFITDKIKKEYQNYVRIACFSETRDSILMWSHYADEHKGFCIEYDTSKIKEEVKGKLLPIVYTDELYDASECLATKDYNIAYNASLFKATQWNYEKEWRIFITTKECNKEKGECINLSNAISAIHIGAKCNQEDIISSIKQYTNENKINLFKAKQSPLRYNLEFEKL